MTATVTTSGPAPEARCALFYGLLFTTMGVANTYAGIWFSERGLSSAEIGWINAAPVLALLCLNVAVGRLADRASDWRSVIVLCSCLAAILPAGLLVAEAFWHIFLVWTLGQTVLGVAMPVADAATLKLTRRRGTEFGPIRAWGTVGYLVALVAMGYAAEAWGPTAFLPIFLGAAALRAAASIALPRFRAPEADEAPMPGARTFAELLRPWFILPLVGVAILMASHMILNAFQGLLWQRQGIEVGMIGLLIAFGAAAETAMFLLWGRVRTRAPLRVLLVFAGAVTVLRWVLMATAPDVAWLWPLQALHGITFGMTLMASLAFVNEHTTERIAAAAQGLNVMLQQGMSVLALLGFGFLADAYGAASYLASAAVALLGITAIAMSLRLRPPA